MWQRVSELFRQRKRRIARRMRFVRSQSAVAAIESLEPRIVLSGVNGPLAEAAEESLFLVEFNDVRTPSEVSRTEWHRAFVLDLEQTLSTEIELDRSFTHALNAVSLLLTATEADAVREDARVAAVMADGRSQLQSNSAEDTGAPGVWNGTALTSADGTRGEGILIGIIDSGIDFDNPSFSAVGPIDGFEHTNPFGEGEYLGLCDSSSPSFDPSLPCNSKLVGAYDFTSDTTINDAGFADHGTSVAGIAAGNLVEVNIPGTTTTTQISGVAPHANLIAYDVCDSNDGCSNVAIVSAVDQAIADGVDVINMSIGGPTQSPWAGVMAQAMWNAHQAGIFVSVSAGNDGPGPDTLTAPADAPWVTAVAAGSVGPETLVTVSVIGDDVPPELQTLNAIRGQNVELASSVGPVPVRHTADVAPGDHLGSSPIAAGELSGQIALIDRGDSLFATKVANAETAGAIAVVVVNNVAGGPIVMAGVDAAGVPSVMISREDGQLLRQWIESNPDARLTLNAQSTVDRNVVAGFSSRGENEQSDTLAPHITAPGADFSVIAPRATLGTNEWDYFSGTSAASPHIAGAAALLLALNPELTPSEVQSALQLTANNDQLVTGSLEAANPFDRGSGFVDVSAAANAGFVLNETSQNFAAANPLLNGDSTQLNVASFVADDVQDAFVWTREIRSTADTAITWTVGFETENGLFLSVATSQFSLAAGASTDLRLTATLDETVAEDWLFGEVQLTPDNGGPVLEFPVAVRAQRSPEIRIIETGTGTDASEAGAVDQYDLQFSTSPAGTVTIEVSAPPDLQLSADGEVFQDSLTLFVSDSFPRTIHVQAVDDTLAESTHFPLLQHRITASTSALYPVGQEIPDVDVHVFDNDRGQLSISTSADSVTEGVAGVDLTVARSENSDIADALPFVLSASDQVRILNSEGEVVQSFMIPAEQSSVSLTLQAADDFLIEDAFTQRITVSATQYDGAFKDVLVTDNDVATLKTIESNGGTVVSRIGTTDSFSVQLRAEPRSSVEVTVTSQSPQLVAVDQDRLTFTPESWSTPQFITVTGRDDDGVEPASTEIILRVDPSVSDDDFDDLSPVSVRVDIVDSAGDLPQIISPRGRTLLDPPTFRWAAVNNAVSYDLYVERSADPGEPVLDINVTETFHVGALPGLGRYRFWVRAHLANGGQTTWIGDVFQISVAPVIDPLPFYATNPQPEIRWSGVAGANRYQIYVSNITTGQAGVYDDSQLLENRYVAPEEFGFGVHRIWVRGIDAEGWAGDWSAPVDYYAGPNPTSPIRSTFDHQPEFRWTAVSEATAYEIFIRVPGGDSIITTVTDPTFTHATPLQTGRHVWWVRPISSEGLKGPWSRRSESFIGGRSQVIAPAASTDNAAPDITWDTVDGAVAYNVFLNRRDVPQHITAQRVESTSWNPGILADGDYRVWVQPIDATEQLGLWSVAYDFAVAAAENDLRAAPLSSETVSFSNTPTLGWAAVDGAASYEIFILHGADTIHVGGITGTVWISPDLGESEGRWWVRAADAEGRLGPWSDPVVWNTVGRPITAVPSVTSNGIRFDWSHVQGADRFILQVDNLTTGESQVIRQDDLTDSAFFYTGSLPSGRYRFWVRAIRNANPSEGFWSQAGDFTLA